MVINKMASKERNLAKNILYLSFVQILNYALPLMMFPVITRFLNFNDFGKVVLVLTIMMVGMVVIEFGFNLTGPLRISEKLNNKLEINIYISNVTIIKFFISLLFSLFFIFYCFFISSIRFNILEQVLICINFVLNIFNLTWYFQAIEKMQVIMINNFISKVIYLVMILIFIPIYPYFDTFLILYTIMSIILVLGYIFEIKKEGIFLKNNNVSMGELYTVAKENFGYFISRISVITYTSLNVILISEKQGLKIAAIYGVAEKIYQMGLNVLSPITNAFYPYMIKNKNYRLISCFIFFGVFVLGVGCSLFHFLSLDIIRIIFGLKYIDVVKILPYFYSLIILVFISMNIGYPFLGALGYSYLVNYSVYLGAIVFLFLTVFFEITMSQVILNMMITELIVLLLRFFLLVYILKFLR